VAASGQRFVTHRVFNNFTEEAVNFYVTAFGNDSEIHSTVNYPETGLPEFQQDLAGQLLVADFALRGYRLTAINAGEQFTPTPALSFMVNFDPLHYSDEQTALADLEHLWDQLISEGQVLMPLKQYEFSARYGWVQDRYGVSWQLILTDPEGEPRPFIMPCLMFGAAHQNQAAAAVDYWTDVFPDSQRPPSR